MKAFSYLVQRVAMPAVTRWAGTDFWRIYRDTASAMSSDHVGGGERFRSQRDGRLGSLLAHAAGQTEYYAERLAGHVSRTGAAGSAEAMLEIPRLTKADVAAQFPDRITSRAKVYGPWRVVSSSGTVDRTMAVHDFRKRDVARAAQILALATAAEYQPGLRYMEIPPNVCRQTCGANHDQADPGWAGLVRDVVLQRKPVRSEAISDLRNLMERRVFYRRMEVPSYWSDSLVQPASVLDDCLRRIDEYRPWVLKALAVYLYALAVRVQESGQRPPRIEHAIMPMGSSLSPYMRGVVESAFGLPVSEDYGSSELGGIAAESFGSPGLIPFRDFMLVEVMRGGRRARPGELGTVLVTDLFNFAMPFIRYEIGDLARVLEVEEGTGLPIRFAICGRMDDSVVSDQGEVIPADALVDLMLSHPGVLLAQLEITPRGGAFLQVSPRAGAAPDLKALESKLREAIGPSIRIASRVSPSIRPEASGKFRFVKNACPARRPEF